MSDHFDPLHRWYRSIWGDHLHHGLWLAGTETLAEAKRNLVIEVACLARIREGTRVCDVGCGYGGTSCMLADEFKSRVTGITDSKEQFKFLEETTSDNPGFRLENWLENRLTNESFDVVLAIETTPHFCDPRHGIAEMGRVLVQGGRLVISTWIADDSPSWFARRMLLEPIRRAGAMPGLACEEKHIGWLRDAGLEVVSSRRIGAEVKRTWSLCFLDALMAWRRDRDLRRETLRHPLRAMSLALSLLRIWLAYQLSVLDYGLFVAVKP